MFKPEAVKDILKYGTRLISVKSDGTNVYTVSNSPRVLFKYDLSTLTLTASTTIFTTSVTPTDLCLVPGSAVVVSSSARTAFVDLTTLYTTEVTTNAAATTTASIGQQIAYNSTAGFALATAAINGQMTLIDPGAGTHSAFILSSPEVTGTSRVSCVITKTASTHDSDTLNWIIGTTNGVVLEVNSSAIISKTLTLPRTPNTGTTNYQGITGISYDYPNLAVTTDHGLLYVYNYDSSSLIYTQALGDGTDTAGAQIGHTLCASVSGITFIGRGLAGNTGGSPTTLMYLRENNPTFCFINRKSAEVEYSSTIVNTYALENLNTSTPNAYSIRRYLIDGIEFTTEDTEIHEPVGVRVPGRIIRILDNGPGQSSVELDVNISAATTTLPCRNGANYIEIAINNGDDEWDIREFTK